MKLPKTIRILGHDYEVKEMENGRVLDGHCHPAEHAIFVHKGMPDKETQDALWHEILHAIDSELDLDLSHQTMISVSKVQFAVIADNPGLFDLKEKP